jgi:UDP-2,4-diacetamido-2,4,6-trideoxy-beta-L-altropyranose hydrolase
MKIAFRADASVQIGTGHVMRCLTLADALREQGAECLFICRPHAGHLLDLIAQRGHKVVALPGLPANAAGASGDTVHAHWLGTDWSHDAADTRQALGAETVDWLIVDHYALDRRWEQALRPSCQRLMVIDDLADRPHDCDLLLDQNLGRSAEDYNGLTPGNATRLIGPQYALLRPEFAQLRSASLARRAQPKLKRLLITMGGVDKDNATGQVLDALKACPLPKGLEITVVMGPHAPWLQHVQAQAQQMPWPTQVLAGVSNMSQLMAECDLAIGAAGSTSWERCCLGLPTIMLVLADNQREIAQALDSVGAALMKDLSTLSGRYLISPEQIDTNTLATISEAAASVTDGLGAQHVVESLNRQG